MKAKENIAPKQQRPQMHLQNEQLDQFQAELAQTLTGDGIKTNVKITLSRVESKLHIVVKGPPDATSAVIKRIRDAIVNTRNHTEAI